MANISIVTATEMMATARRVAMIKHPHRCEICEYELCTNGRHWSDPEYIKWKKCPYKKEEKYYELKEEARIPEAIHLFTSYCGCASHSSQPETGCRYALEFSGTIQCHSQDKCKYQQESDITPGTVYCMQEEMNDAE